jgi:signal transduction histidine kinase
VSLGIAIFATLYASRLERRLISQLEKDARNTRALQQLSTRLITAQEEERGRIARELHDEVGQALTAIKVELAVAQRKIHAGASELLEPAQAITDRTLNTVRDLSHLLHPPMLDDLGMVAAVESYVRGFSKRHDLRVDFRQDDLATRLAPEIEVAAYRIVQEALTNVVKHAGASACRVALGRYQSKLLIVVADDGRGFDLRELEDPARHGLGLIGIRERVSQLNGSLVMDSVPGRGTTLRVEIPLDSTGHRLDGDARVADDALQPESAHG